jgi:hypothetical protein
VRAKRPFDAKRLFWASPSPGADPSKCPVQQNAPMALAPAKSPSVRYARSLRIDFFADKLCRGQSSWEDLMNSTQAPIGKAFGAVLLGLLPAMPVAAAPVIFSVGGTSSPASIQATVDTFRAALGDPNNGNAPGTTDGRREINWDGGGVNANAVTGAPPHWLLTDPRRAIHHAWNWLYPSTSLGWNAGRLGGFLRQSDLRHYFQYVQSLTSFHPDR